MAPIRFLIKLKCNTPGDLKRPFFDVGYGRTSPTNFHGLRYEPANEQGVVLIFGMLAKDLGYMIEAMQSGFPDCEAIRRVGSDNWQRVRIGGWPAGFWADARNPAVRKL